MPLGEKERGESKASPTEERLRIDLLLRRLCLFKTRSQASKACDENRVWLNDALCRASREARAGDRIRIRDRLERFEEEVRVLAIPKQPVAKMEARRYYEVSARRELPGPLAPDGVGPEAS